MVILLIIVFLQFKLAVMHQRDHFVCLYLKTWRVRFLLFPSPIPFKFQNFVNSGPAQFQQVMQKIIGCRTYALHIEFFFKKSGIIKGTFQVFKWFIDFKQECFGNIFSIGSYFKFILRWWPSWISNMKRKKFCKGPFNYYSCPFQNPKLYIIKQFIFQNMCVCCKKKKGSLIIFI